MISLGSPKLQRQAPGSTQADDIRDALGSVNRFLIPYRVNMGSEHLAIRRWAALTRPGVPRSPGDCPNTCRPPEASTKGKHRVAPKGYFQKVMHLPKYERRYFT
jgi:hypothetical protein